MAAQPGYRAHAGRREFFGQLTARLVAYAEWDFRLLKPQQSGITLREAFRRFRRDTGQKHPEDKGPLVPLPPGGRLILDWFWDLNRGRQAGMGGYLTLPATEIEAWGRLRGIQPRQWQLDLLYRLEAKFLEVMGEKTD